MRIVILLRITICLQHLLYACFGVLYVLCIVCISWSNSLRLFVWQNVHWKYVTCVNIFWLLNTHICVCVCIRWPNPPMLVWRDSDHFSNGLFINLCNICNVQIISLIDIQGTLSIQTEAEQYCNLSINWWNSWLCREQFWKLLYGFIHPHLWMFSCQICCNIEEQFKHSNHLGIYWQSMIVIYSHRYHRNTNTNTHMWIYWSDTYNYIAKIILSMQHAIQLTCRATRRAWFQSN